jgi:hypothetical protein
MPQSESCTQKFAAHFSQLKRLGKPLFGRHASENAQIQVMVGAPLQVQVTMLSMLGQLCQRVRVTRITCLPAYSKLRFAVR